MANQGNLGMRSCGSAAQIRPHAKPYNAEVAQLVEQCFRKAEVVGSNPTFGSRKFHE